MTWAMIKSGYWRCYHLGKQVGFVRRAIPGTWDGYALARNKRRPQRLVGSGNIREVRIAVEQSGLVDRLCRFCGQPMKPKGVRKRPNEYDHAQGCPYTREGR